MRKLWRNFIGKYYYKKKFGRAGAKLYSDIKRGNTNPLNVPMTQHPVYLRPGTSDIQTFEQLFYEDEYGFALDFVPRTIIDGGANIGLAAIYFSNKYPEAKIISIEPEPSNFEMLVKNTVNYNNVSAHNAALTKNSKAKIIIEDKGLGHWGFMTTEVSGDVPQDAVVIPTISIFDLMRENNFESIDLLKIDIEGAEKELFETGYESWLPKTRVLVVELHDRMKKGCSKSVFSAVCKYDFSFSHKGENLIFTNNALIE